MVPAVCGIFEPDPRAIWEYDKDTQVPEDLPHGTADLEVLPFYLLEDRHLDIFCKDPGDDPTVLIDRIIDPEVSIRLKTWSSPTSSTIATYYNNRSGMMQTCPFRSLVTVR
jgi:hypothetical protein